MMAEMQQLLVAGLGGATRVLTLEEGWVDVEAKSHVAEVYALPEESFYLTSASKLVQPGVCLSEVLIANKNNTSNTTNMLVTLRVHFRGLGGIDFQHREGSKIGSGGQLSDSHAALGRRERLRKLALETIDLQKDPYFMRNHLGSYECKLCLTLHVNEGNYLAHTQGKRHQSNLGRRAAMDAKAAAPKPIQTRDVQKHSAVKIGRPAYKVTKSREATSLQRCLSFEIDYPQAAEGLQPRHRFMSVYEQKVEVPDNKYQYILFACEPYETIGKQQSKFDFECTLHVRAGFDTTHLHNRKTHSTPSQNFTQRYSI